jgi:phospholipase C
LDDTGGLPVPGGDRHARNVLRGVEAGMPGSATRASALDHVVVVLFENRSLDNVLGRLYGPGDVKAFEGVIGKELSNL